MNNNLNIEKYREISQQFITEEDVRAETNMFLRVSCDAFGISLRDSGHEVTSFYGGRADSMYSDVIIEYKAPGVNLNSTKGYNEVIYGRDARDHGLFHYLINFSLENAHNNNEMFLKLLKDRVGVGFNGRTFIFARFVDSAKTTLLYDEGKTKTFPDEITTAQRVDFQTEVIDDIDIGFKKLMLYLRSTSRKILSSQSILELFGPGSDICNKSIPMILDCLLECFANNNLRVKDPI
jgi:hypothetical protein